MLKSNSERLTLTVIITVTLSCCLIQLTDCQRVRNGDRTRLLPWTSQVYPNPWKDPKRCGRTLPAFICDPDKLFTTDQNSNIDRILWDYSRNSICLCDTCSFADKGITIGVALLEDADVVNIGQDQRYEGIKPTWSQFADELRNNWSLGACDNDVLLVISPSGGAISFGRVTAKILERSFVRKLTSSDFPRSQDEQVKFINKIIDEIHSYDLEKEGPYTAGSILLPVDILKTPNNEDTNIKPSGPPTIKEDNELFMPGSTLSSSRPTINTQSASTYIAATEDDEFKVPEDKKISSSLAFMIVGSLTVILVSLIALFLIIWYYRTKTGNIEPNTIYTTKPPTEEKTPTDIKAVKYEPCKTDEPGLPV